MNISDIINSVDEVKEIIGEMICDKLKGDCNKCPFKIDCISTKLNEIELQLGFIKDKMKEII